MRPLTLACLLFLPVPASADLIRTLSHDADSGAWTLTAPGWTATLAVENADEMQAELRLQPDDGAASSAQFDMMGQTLPLLISIDEVLLCGDTPEIAVTLADLIPEGDHGRYVYRRLIFGQDGVFLGATLDEASANAGGPLPIAVIAGELGGLCAD